MDWFAFVIRLLLSLVIGELLSWNSLLCNKILRLSVNVLPKGHQERYKEEFEAALSTVNGPCCRVLYSSGFIVASLKIRYELYKIYEGKYEYSLLDAKNNVQLKGQLLFERKWLFSAYAHGILKEVKCGDGETEDVNICWRSDQVVLEVDPDGKSYLKVNYRIGLYDSIIKGQFKITYDEKNNNLRGLLDRFPVEKGIITLYRRKRK